MRVTVDNNSQKLFVCFLKLDYLGKTFIYNQLRKPLNSYFFLRNYFYTFSSNKISKFFEQYLNITHCLLSKIKIVLVTAFYKVSNCLRKWKKKNIQITEYTHWWPISYKKYIQLSPLHQSSSQVQRKGGMTVYFHVLWISEIKKCN